jgi:arsenical resistance protein ArsH
MGSLEVGFRTLAQCYSLAISESEDDPEVRRKYRPFLLPADSRQNYWISELELETVIRAVEKDLARTQSRLKVLALYGSLRQRFQPTHPLQPPPPSQRIRTNSLPQLLLETHGLRSLSHPALPRLLFNPSDLPIRDSVPATHPAVPELRSLSLWSDRHIWVCPEQHGCPTAVFKNQIDWIPLAQGSVRPTQGRTLGVVQVNGGSQSFNIVSALRILGRRMRKFVIPNQSSLPTAWKAFEDEGRSGMGGRGYCRRGIGIGWLIV